MKLGFLLVLGGLVIPVSGQPNSSEGIVAYVRDGSEIRLVAPDGTNDHLLWEHPRARQATALRGIHSLAWQPGGESLVFSSDHENAYSYYDYDLYTIGSNGTAPHRLTNAPDLTELAKFPKGQASVTIENRQIPYSGAPYSTVTTLFFVYVGGAEKSQMVTVAPGGRKTLVFEVARVADAPQAVIAIGGLQRWPGAPIRVQPGQNINVTLAIIGPGLRSFGAFDPAWSSDGARVAYRFGMCAGIWSVPAAPAPGVAIGNTFAGTGKDRSACAFDWAPTGVSGPPILYSNWLSQNGDTDNSIYQTDEQGSKVTRLVHFDSSMERITGVRWLPDGSGFLFARAESRGVVTSSNLYRYDFRARTITPVTRLQDQHVRAFSVSPDGRWVVYERGKDLYYPSDKDRPALWLLRTDGSQERLFVANASSPAWGRVSGSRISTAATSEPTAAATAPPTPRPADPAPDLSALSSEAVSAANRGDYDSATRAAREVLRVDPTRKEALFALAVSAYGTAEFDLFERSAPDAVRNGAGMSFNLLHHHTLTGGHPAMLGIKQSAIVFDPMKAKDCNQRAFEEPLANIVSASQTATASGEVFLTLKMRDSQGKVRTLNFGDPGSTVDKSGGLPVLREPPDAARRLQAVANVIAATVKPSIAAARYKEESNATPAPASAGSAVPEQQHPNPATNANTPQRGIAGGTNTVAPGMRSRVPDGESVLLCTDPVRLDGAMDFAKYGSAANAYQALRNEAFFRVTGPALLEVRESDLRSRWPKVLVRVLDGAYAGRTGWLVLSELKNLNQPAR